MVFQLIPYSGIYHVCVLIAKPGKGKGKAKETSGNSTTAGTGVTILSEKKLFLGQKVRLCPS
jgi:hypothetical protein